MNNIARLCYEVSCIDSVTQPRQELIFGGRMANEVDENQANAQVSRWLDWLGLMMLLYHGICANRVQLGLVGRRLRATLVGARIYTRDSMN